MSVGSSSRVLTRDSADALIDYPAQGKRSYLLASTYSEDDEAAILRRLSAEFERCAAGLGRVRQEWESLASQPDRPEPPVHGTAARPQPSTST